MSTNKILSNINYNIILTDKQPLMYPTQLKPWKNVVHLPAHNHKFPLKNFPRGIFATSAQPLSACTSRPLQHKPHFRAFAQIVWRPSNQNDLNSTVMEEDGRAYYMAVGQHIIKYLNGCCWLRFKWYILYSSFGAENGKTNGSEMNSNK